MNNINIFKNTVALAVALAALLCVVLMPTLISPARVGAADARIKDSLCKGGDQIEIGYVSGNECEAAKGKTGGTETSVNALIARIINIFSVIVGIIAVVMVIYGGLKFITSGGDSGRLTSAKQTIIYAIIGLIIVALAQFIVRFVLTNTPDA